MEVKKNSFKAWFLAARPKTLTGAAVPVMIGLALAWKDAALYQGDVFNWVPAVLCLLFAFIMQIDANFINDFVDYAKGTDDRETRLGPERACTQGWVSIDAMKHAIAATTILACLVGLPLVWFGGMEMILIGMICVAFCFLYTTHLSYMGLGDVLVLLCFGLIPVSITYYVQLHTVTVEVLVASLACGIVIDGLLLVNNFRDRDTDKLAGKNTLVVKVGENTAIMLYLSVGIVACLMGLVFGIYGSWWAFGLPFIYLILHVFTFLKMKRIWKGRELNKCLGETARNIFIYGLLVTIGILVS
jgi:1,4-dihydroxy-2-naphthoate octaprenyltransferase